MDNYVDGRRLQELGKIDHPSLTDFKMLTNNLKCALNIKNYSLSCILTYDTHLGSCEHWFECS